MQHESNHTVIPVSRWCWAKSQVAQTCMYFLLSWPWRQRQLRGREAPFILLNTEVVFLPPVRESKGNGALEPTLKGNGENAVPLQSWRKTTDRVRRRVFYFQAAKPQMKYDRREIENAVTRENFSGVWSCSYFAILFCGWCVFVPWTK